MTGMNSSLNSNGAVFKPQDSVPGRPLRQGDKRLQKSVVKLPLVGEGAAADPSKGFEIILPSSPPIEKLRALSLYTGMLSPRNSGGSPPPSPQTTGDTGANGSPPLSPPRERSGIEPQTDTTQPSNLLALSRVARQLLELDATGILCEPVKDLEVDPRQLTRRFEPKEIEKLFENTDLSDIDS